ncbi:eukaryotic translation initiation factor 4 gamma [Thraustotheca clavata]|uniref:Eukaryotic translation initiation factor 4 gamma n=1 Tax=Thraustotheca clavata TaxID=74557 RepID=A0A1V9Y791_9STRA|nr:eukaryotic translation initiation factor 4 gamma [Thraustotheca clavata]
MAARFPATGAMEGQEALRTMPVRTASAPPGEQLDPTRPSFSPYRGNAGYNRSTYAPPAATAGVFVPGQPFVPRGAVEPSVNVHGIPQPPMNGPGTPNRGMPRGPARMNNNGPRPYMQNQGYNIPRMQQPNMYYQGYNMQPMPNQPIYPMNQYGPMQPPHLPMVPQHVPMMPQQQISPPVQRQPPVARERKAILIVDPRTGKPIDACKDLPTDLTTVVKPRTNSDASRPASTLKATSAPFNPHGNAPLPPTPYTPSTPATPKSPKESFCHTKERTTPQPASTSSTPSTQPASPKTIETPKAVSPKKTPAPTVEVVASPKAKAVEKPKVDSPKKEGKTAAKKEVVSSKKDVVESSKPKTPVASPKKVVEASIMFGTVEVTAPVTVVPSPKATPAAPKIPILSPKPVAQVPKPVVQSPKPVPKSPKQVPQSPKQVPLSPKPTKAATPVTSPKAAPPPGFNINEESDNENDEESPLSPPARTVPRPVNTAANKYDKICFSVEFLLSFREEYVELPEAAKDPHSGWMSMEITSDAPSRNRRVDRQSSGGSLQRQTSRGDKGKWNRDQKVAEGRGGRGNRSGRGGRGGGGSQSSFDDVPLKRREDRWVPKKATSNIEAVAKQVQSIMNKMTNQKFDRLAGQLAEIDMESPEMVLSVIKIIFDKALGEPHFCDMYANLCVFLDQKWNVWSYLQIVQNDDERKWYWTTMSDNDAEVVGPFSTINDLFESAADDPIDVVAAPEGIKLKQVRVRNGKFIKIWEVNNELYWSGQNVEDLGSSQTLVGPFEAFEQANINAVKSTSFKRILLNSCQEEFEKDNIYEELENSLEKSRADGSLTPEVEADFEEKKMLTKRRMLGNIRFIGELYKKGMLQERIMHECIKKLLNVTTVMVQGEPPRLAPVHPNTPPDEESIESLSKLLTTMGKVLEASSQNSYAAVSSYFDYLTKLVKDKRLSSRITFMLMDVIDLRNDRWQPRRKELTQKTREEIRKDVEKELASKPAQPTRGGGNRGLQPSASARDRDGGRGGFRNNAPPPVARSTSFATPSTRGSNNTGGRPATFGSKNRGAKQQAKPVPKKITAKDIEQQIEAHDESVINTLRKESKSILDEYVGLQDITEAATCLAELKTKNGTVAPLLISAIFVKEAIAVAIEEKQATRDGMYDAVVTLFGQKALEPEAVLFGAECGVLLAPDLACDVPKIGDHLATIVSRVIPIAPTVLTIEWLTINILTNKETDEGILQELVEGGVLANIVGLTLAKLPPTLAAQQANTAFRYLNISSILPSYSRDAKSIHEWVSKHNLAAVLPALVKALDVLKVAQDGKTIDTLKVITHIERNIPIELRLDPFFAKQACLFIAELTKFERPSHDLCSLLMGLGGDVAGQAAFVGGLAQAAPTESLKTLLRHLQDNHVFNNGAIRAWSESPQHRLCVQGNALAVMDDIVSCIRK